MNHSSPLPQSAHRALYAPRYWFTWLSLGLLRSTVYLPTRLRHLLARGLSLCLWLLAAHRRHVTQVNVGLCFPALSPIQQKILVKKIFYENTLGIFETAQAYWAKKESFHGRIHFENLSILQQAYTSGKGVVLVGAHYTTLDLAGLLFSLSFPVDVFYQPHKNPVLEKIIRQSRQRWAEKVIPRHQVREAFQSLKQGHIFWYPADQDHGPKQSVFAPFFGVPAATLTTPGRFAQANGSAVIIIGFHRLPNNHYVFNFSELKNYPSENPITDATQMNQALEQQIRRFPEQYMWVHRRFKTRPEGELSVY